jgi:hypothetical protein
VVQEKAKPSLLRVRWSAMINVRRSGRRHCLPAPSRLAIRPALKVHSKEDLVKIASQMSRKLLSPGWYKLGSRGEFFDGRLRKSGGPCEMYRSPLDGVHAFNQTCTHMCIWKVQASPVTGVPLRVIGGSLHPSRSATRIKLRLDARLEGRTGPE